jgi:hypothetical protein
MFMNEKSGTAGFYGGDKYSDAGGRSWTVSYMADPGDGSGFAEKRLVVGSRPEDGT